MENGRNCPVVTIWANHIGKTKLLFEQCHKLLEDYVHVTKKSPHIAAAELSEKETDPVLKKYYSDIAVKARY